MINSIEELTKIHKRFYLYRKQDISGISGTGVVALGILFPNNKCVISWLGEHSSINEYDNLEDLEYIHGHGHATIIKWMD